MSRVSTVAMTIAHLIDILNGPCYMCVSFEIRSEYTMATSSMLHIRLDDATKAKGTAVLDAIGLSASDAVRILYHRLIADQAFPLEMKVPNAETRAAIAEADAIIAARQARHANADELFSDLEKNSSK
jgi:DNA-damage-inducible protein J